MHFQDDQYLATQYYGWNAVKRDFSGTNENYPHGGLKMYFFLRFWG
jgi:hypothetical protein